MAVGLSPGVANAFLNALCRAVNYTAPTAIWVQLHTAEPGAAGTTAIATETTRKQGTFATAAASGLISNTAVLTWTNIAGSQDASHYSLWDASTAGTFLGSGVITANAYVAGDTYNMAVGAVVLGFTVAA
jgi:hypothetical protein